jgi:hypothetical protein
MTTFVLGILIGALAVEVYLLKKRLREIQVTLVTRKLMGDMDHISQLTGISQNNTANAAQQQKASNFHGILQSQSDLNVLRGVPLGGISGKSLGQWKGTGQSQ